MQVTKKQLESKIAYLNVMTGNPEKPWNAPVEGAKYGSRITVLLNLSQELNAAEQKHIINCSDQTCASGDVDILFRRHNAALCRSDTTKTLKEAGFALRQAYNWL